MTPPTDQPLDLDEILGRAGHLYEYVHQSDEADVLAGTDVPQLAEEIRRLRAELAEARERLAAYGTPLIGGVPLPPTDPTYERMEAKRMELTEGFTDQEWAVGRVLCPAAFKCTKHPLTLFVPLKNGCLPLHRNDLNIACSGSHKKPDMPPLQLRTAAVSAAARP
ncbi:hypothetical protein [Streptomyces sp. NPDC051636]|uniref:hypothetical protein n=1 Tax=Streptomyces sp. NPDC051636 TaxID=3365663 RepID=UPI0037BC0473